MAAPKNVEIRSTTESIIFNWTQSGALPEFYDVSYQSSEGSLIQVNLYPQVHQTYDALVDEDCKLSFEIPSQQPELTSNSANKQRLDPGTVYSGVIKSVDTRLKTISSAGYSWRICTGKLLHFKLLTFKKNQWQTRQ